VTCQIHPNSCFWLSERRLAKERERWEEIIDERVKGQVQESGV